MKSKLTASLTTGFDCRKRVASPFMQHSRLILSFLCVIIIGVAQAQVVYLSTCVDRATPVWDGNCIGLGCNITHPCCGFTGDTFTNANCHVILLPTFDQALNISAAGHSLEVSTTETLKSVPHIMAFGSDIFVRFNSFALDPPHRDAYLIGDAPTIYIENSNINTNASNHRFYNVKNFHIRDSMLVSNQGAPLAVAINALEGLQVRKVEILNSIFSSLDGTMIGLQLGWPFNVSINGLSASARAIMTGDLTNMVMENVSISQYAENGIPLFYSFSLGFTMIGNSNFSCVLNCGPGTLVFKRDQASTFIEVDGVRLANTSLFMSDTAVENHVTVDNSISNAPLGTFGAANRAALSIHITKSQFASNALLPAFGYATTNEDLFLCAPDNNKFLRPTPSDVAVFKMTNTGSSVLHLACPSVLPSMELKGTFQMIGKLHVKEQIISNQFAMFANGDIDTIMILGSVELINVALDMSIGGLLYTPTIPLEGMKLTSSSVTISGSTELIVDWPLSLGYAPQPSVIYPICPSTHGVTTPTTSTYGEWSVATYFNNSHLNFFYNPVPCNVDCVSNATAICASTERCFCKSNWFGPLCDCDQTEAPDGVFCSIYGGQNWILDGTMFLPPDASVTLADDYTLNVLGDMRLDGNVSVGDGTVVIATGVIYSNGKLFGSCKLRELRLNGACIVYSTVSVQSFALEFSSLTEIELELDASDLTTDDSCVPPNPSDALDHLVNSTFAAFTHSVMSSNASWRFKLVGGRNSSNPQDLSKLKFKTQILTSGDISKSTGSTSKLLSETPNSGSCSNVVNPIGQMSLFVQPCDPNNNNNNNNPASKKKLAWYIIVAPIIGAVALIGAIILIVLKVGAVRSVILPYHKSN
jgi:hypothetical protein